MTWLDNPIANLYGPYFLALYAAVAVAGIVVARWLTRDRDPTASLDPEPVPAEPDHYEIAYLRGGAAEVCRLAVAELLQRGYVELDGGIIMRAPDAPDDAHLPPPARTVLDWFQDETPCSFKDLFTAGGPQDRLQSYCSEVRARLEGRQLLAGPAIRSYRNRVVGLAGLLLLAFGGYKLTVALTKGFTNVGFLVMMMIAAVVVLGFQFRGLGSLTSRGRTYLERLRLAFDSFRERVSWDTTAGSDPRTLLTVGIFGAAALTGPLFLDFGTALADFEKSLQRSTSDGGAVGGCGDGGGSGCGGGCGGCGE